jgi:hypothetical protein
MCDVYAWWECVQFTAALLWRDVMLMEYLERAHEIGAAAIEIEYKDGRDWIFAYSGNTGAGIGSLPYSQREAIMKEMDDLKKTKQATLGGVAFRLKFSTYESFGEWVHRIELRPLPHPAGAGGRGSGPVVPIRRASKKA